MPPEVFADDAVEPQIVSSETAFRGYIWSVDSETFVYNDSELTREFLVHPGAVAVVALDDDDRMLAIKQYRHPIRARDWEIPAGLLDVAGESLLLAAQRELAEETDMQASEWHLLLDLYTSPGGSTEKVWIFLARGLSAVEAVFDREAEEVDIETRWISLDEVTAAIAAGTIHNSLLIAGALSASAARTAGWTTLRDAGT
jgi:8-oxo-dGDP phosphatase